LRWDEVDLERGFLFLTDSKTGQKTVQLNSAAKEVLAGQERMLSNPYVFPSPVKPGRPYYSINDFWAGVRKKAGLNGVRLHDLRHSFASYGTAQGLTLYQIGSLLGHRQPATTARYADLVDSAAKQAAETIGAAIQDAMKTVSREPT
jgi:integrase